MRLITEGFFKFTTKNETCGLCKSVYEVEENDLVIKTRQAEDGPQWDSYTVTKYEAFWTCPSCRNANKVTLSSESAKLLSQKRLRQEADYRARGNSIP